MLHSTFKFHHPYFLSGVLVVTCVLPRAEPAVSTHDNAYMDGTDTARRQNGFVMAQRASAQGVVHPIRNRIIESFWSMQSAQTDLLHAAARKSCTRRPLPPGRYLDTPLPPLFPE